MFGKQNLKHVRRTLVFHLKGNNMVPKLCHGHVVGLQSSIFKLTFNLEANKIEFIELLTKIYVWCQ